MTVESIAIAAYLVAALLFIMSLAGLSKHETAKHGIWFGIWGMAIALAATVALSVSGTHGHEPLTTVGIVLMIVAVVAGAAAGSPSSISAQKLRSVPSSVRAGPRALKS